MVQLYLSGKLSLLLLPATSRGYLITCALSFQYCSYSLNWKQWCKKITVHHKHMASLPIVGGVRVAHLFVFGVVFCCLRPVSCIPKFRSVSGLPIMDCPFSILLCLFVFRHVCPMMPGSPDCPFLIALSVLSSVYLSCVLCAQCSTCLWIVHSWVPLRFSLDCHFLIVPSVLSNLYFIHYHLKWIKIQKYT